MKLADVNVVDQLPQGRAAFWFTYNSDALQKAAGKQAAWHEARAAEAEAQAVALEQRIRESGMELREQMVTGGPRFAAVVDQELGEQLAVARSRRDRHAGAGRTFRAWEGAFGAADTSRVYHLTVQDVDYFALHREPGD